MNLRKKQSVFALNVSKLIKHAYDNGYELTIGEAQRTNDMQLLYFMGYTLMVCGGSLKLAKTKIKSKTMNSKHLNKTAIDLNVFKDGEYLTKKEDVQFLGDYWESLHEKCKWGGNWRFLDTPHFQMF